MDRAARIVAGKGKDMTDREELELAAKAAGLKIHVARQVERDEEGHANSGLWIVNGSTCWNPLINDGDALRLAVKLDLSSLMIFQSSGEKHREFWSPNSGYDGGKSATTKDEYKDDPYAATRRAIVRAAAAIGEQM